MKKGWVKPRIKHGKPTKWGWVVYYPKNLVLGEYVDIGCFTFIHAGAGVIIEDGVQIGGGCHIYSVSSIDGRNGMVILKKECKIGSNTVIMPGVVVGEKAVVGAMSFIPFGVEIPAGEVWAGIPARPLKSGGRCFNKSF